MKIREAFPPLLASAGLSWVAVSVLDPFRPLGSVVGPLLVLTALSVQLARKKRARAYAFAAALAVAWGVAAGILMEFRADSVSYFAYLRSASFDFDLDFRNERQALRGEEEGGRGRRVSVFSAGPAVVWSPFYLAAHVYVRLDRALGRELYLADGLSLPYRRATLLGTVTVVVLGGFLLFSDRLVGWSPLGIEWQEIPFLVPKESLIRGENAFCLRFGGALTDPGEPPVAALVEKIELP